MTRDQIEAMARAPHAYASGDLSEALTSLLNTPMRRPLPNRRRNETVNTRWTAPDETVHAFAVSVGVDHTGRAWEVFANHAKGSLAAMLADVCTIISVALQHGIPPEAFAKSLGRVPAWPGNGAIAPASPIGTILAAIIASEVPPMPGAVVVTPPLVLDVGGQAAAVDHIGEAGE